MTRTQLLQHFDPLAETPEAVAKLRNFVFHLATRGKLVPQSSTDESATELAKRVTTLGQRIAKEQKIKLPTPEAAITEADKKFRLPIGWAWVKLGDLSVKLGAGSTPLGGKRVYQNSGIKFLRSQNVWNEGLHLDDVALIAPAIHKDMDSTCVEPGDVLLNITGASIGRCAVVPDDFDEANVSQHVAIVRLADKVLRQFIHLIIIAPDFQSQIMQVQVGVSREGLSMKNLKEFVVALPPLAEQRRIVAKVEELLALCDALEEAQTAARERRTRLVRSALDHLTTVNGARAVPARSASDHAIGLVNLTAPQRLQPLRAGTARAPQDAFRRHAAFVLNQFPGLTAAPEDVPALRQAILSLAVQGRLVPQNAKDEPAAELLGWIRQQKDQLIGLGKIQNEKHDKARKGKSALFSIPESWQWTRFSELTELITKGSSPKWQGISYVSKDEGVLFVTSENVGTYELRKLDDLKYVEKRFNEIEPRSMLRFGDILLNLVGASIGRAAIYSLQTEANINQAVALIRLMPGITNEFAGFLLHYLNSPAAILHMLSSQVVNAQPNISLTDTRDFPVPVPPLAEQQRIVAKVDELLRWCDALEARLTAARTTATHLLDAALHQILTA